MTIDLAAYFDRTGYQGSSEPTLETLHALVAAHNQAIAFENLDPLMGIPVADLGAAALKDKLVARGRGGYCYEQNGLMGYVLDEVGYGVERFAGRVVWMQPDDAPLPAQTHQVLGGDRAGCRRPVPRRRRIRRADPHLSDPARGGTGATNPPRAVPAARTRRRLGARNRNSWRMACALHLHHPPTTADRPRSRKLVCVDATEVQVRRRVVRGAGSPTTRAGTCGDGTWPFTVAARPNASGSTTQPTCSKR